jgi:NAD(P)-dependent dehydrogenase (short-subunit alcohol dehydrogenase family)
MHSVSSAPRAALVTGASTGIGAATVARLVSAGWHAYASVRQQAHAAALSAAHGDVVTPLVFDITDDAAVQHAGERIVAERGERGLQGVVNNAGIAVAGPLEFLPPAELRHQLDVNLVGQVAVAQTVLPALRTGRGRLVFVSSIAGLSAMPFVGAYSASKHALEAVADSWRLELSTWNIPVIVIEPGVIATPIWETGLRYGNALIEKLPARVTELYGRPLDALRRRAEKGVGGLAPDVVARVIEQALTTPRPRARYLVGSDAKRRAWLERLPTRLRDRLVRTALKRL